jgi:hypothetical protein
MYILDLHGHDMSSYAKRLQCFCPIVNLIVHIVLIKARLPSKSTFPRLK